MTDNLRLGRTARLATILAAGASLAACAAIQPRYPSHAAGPPAAPSGPETYKVGQPYQVAGVWYVPREQPDYDQVGVASWYGDAFDQKPTASGEIFDMTAISAAHTTLPLPSLVEVTNLDNGRKLVVRVNDRGPFVGGRIIDLSHAAARELGYDRAGLANVRVRYVGRAPLLGPEAGVRYAGTKPLPTRLPPTAQDTAKSDSDAPIVLAAAAPARRPEPVETQALPPVTGAEISATPIPPPPAPPVETAAIGPGASSALRIQAGAFSSAANAQRAVSQLAAAGAAVIEPLQRDGMTLYRVVLPAPADEAAAYALRDRVAAVGFADARVVKAF